MSVSRSFVPVARVAPPSQILQLPSSIPLCHVLYHFPHRTLTQCHSNAEASGGGFPGWLQRVKAVLRTPDYLNETANYVQNIGSILAKAQITNGGPIVLVQVENEYSQASPGTVFPNGEYFAAIEAQLRNAGIVLPFIDNDARPQGIFAPGNGTGSVDIYGYDSYPLGFDCQWHFTFCLLYPLAHS